MTLRPRKQTFLVRNGIDYAFTFLALRLRGSCWLAILLDFLVVLASVFSLACACGSFFRLLDFFISASPESLVPGSCFRGVEAVFRRFCVLDPSPWGSPVPFVLLRFPALF